MKGRILIVDDEEQVRNVLASLLQQGGFEVDTADGGISAIRKVQESCPDLVTLDVMMPEMDGFAVVDHLSDLEETPAVIFVSGSPGLIQARQPLPDCVVGCLIKPVRARDLIATCERALSRLAAPPPAILERRRVPRRLLLAGVSVVSGTGEPLLAGEIVQLSPSGAELHLDAQLEPGDS